MSSEPPFGEPGSAGEPPRVERILEAALKTFAARGTEATSLRMIASAAGVSLGLVQHHFTTKANLIQAVDDHVADVLSASLAAPLASVPLADPVDDAARRVMSLLVDHAHVVDYLCRALVDNTPAGARVFDQLVVVCTGYWDQLREQGLTKPGLDPLWIVLSPLVLVLGMFILRAQLNRHLPDAITTPAQLQRWRDATEQIIADGQLRRPPSEPADK
jgi:AcrR family transcriptional regulator